MNWDEYAMKLAEVAATKSKDPVKMQKSLNQEISAISKSGLKRGRNE